MKFTLFYYMPTNNIPRYVFIDGPGNERLIRDTFSMGVLNTDKFAYEAAKQKQEEAYKKITEDLQTKSTVKTLQQNVEELHSEISDIKTVLTLILNKLDSKAS